MIKNSFFSMVATAKLAVLVLLGIPIAAANDGFEPSWHSGVSTWNGAGYDLPVPIQSKQILNGLVTPEDLGSPNSETPYTVPSVPQSNPYFVLNSELELEPALEPTPPSPTSVEFSTEGAEGDLAPFSQSIDPVLPEKMLPKTSDSQATAPEIIRQPDGEVPEIDLVEQPPLQEEVIRWYQYPQRWMRGWDSNAEFGIDGSDGNANTLAIQTGLELNRKTDLYSLAIDFDYRQANNAGVTIENNGRLNIDYDRLIAGSPWSAFGKYGMEWDRFKAFDLRLNLNAGAGYHWIRDDDTTLVTRFGAGASREIGAPIDEWTPEAVFGIDSRRQLNSRNKLTAKIDYFPAWEDFNNYRVVFDAAWEILLDDTDNLSLKLAVTDRYDSTPQGAVPNDVYYALLLLYKF